MNVNFCVRLITVRSLSTSKEISISTMFSSAFGPQRAVTDARQEGEPKVWIWVVFALETLLILSTSIDRMLVPFFGLIGDDQADACRCGAWTQGIGVEQ